MSTRTYAYITIPAGSDPESTRALLRLFSEAVDARPFDERREENFIEPDGSAQIGAEEVSWGVYMDFPEWAARTLTTDRDDEDLPRLPLVPFTWRQDGDGVEAEDWEYVCTPNGQTYDTEEHALCIGGERYVTETAIRHALADPALTTAAQLGAHLLTCLS